MSIEIDWAALTTGPGGAELAETIRAFIHAKFQEVELPRFIRAVEVHAFEFGDACPSIVIKDICDPLPDFYEDDEDDDDDHDEGRHDGPPPSTAHRPAPIDATLPSAQLPQPIPSASLQDRRDAQRMLNVDPTASLPAPASHAHGLAHPLRPPLPRLASNLSLADQLASPLRSRASTPGIPGGTANLSYFHLPLAARMPGGGAPSPLAAVAGWTEHQAQLHAQRTAHHHVVGSGGWSPTYSAGQDPDPSTRPSTAHSHSHGLGFTALHDDPAPRTPSPAPEPDPSDMQIVLHIRYSGNVRLALTAEILLDYPMPSFVGIPLQLNISGLSFDGVALLALLNTVGRTKGGNAGDEDEDEKGGDRRAHFCFLGPEDAATLVGAESVLDDDVEKEEEGGAKTNPMGVRGTAEGEELGSLLREIRVESEIGKTKDGRQNLRNVGKVEKFVLGQVRRIFEDEFVYPSFWTFLV